jgi:D-alanyl-D-alanine dipeptidase
MAWPAYYKLPGSDIDHKGIGELTDVSDGPLAASPFVYARPEVIEKLDRAQAILDACEETSHLQLVVVDGFRPLDLQDSLFQTYKEYLQDKNPEWDEPTLLSEAQKMVSIAPKDPEIIRKAPPHHLTGGAVDVVLVEKSKINFNNDNWLREGVVDFGSDFDEMIHPTYGDIRSQVRFFEQSSENEVARDNRRTLYAVMTAVGFSNYDYEWFHFQSGNQLDAYMNGESSASFGSIQDAYERVNAERVEQARPALEALLMARGRDAEEAIAEAKQDLGIE